jgi:CheY-like chemotaxis protein
LNEILILEDDVANLKGLSGLLRSEEYSVLEASNGFQAIEKAKTFGPISLLISDMDLPRFSGTQIALMLISLYPNMPVLFISGTPRIWWASRDASNFKLFPPSHVDFIEKPFSLSQLLIRVRNLIEGAGNIMTGALSNAA